MVVVLSYATAYKQRKYIRRNFFIKNNSYFCSEYIYIVAMERNTYVREIIWFEV